MMVYAVLVRAGRVTGQPTAGRRQVRDQVGGHGRGQAWGQVGVQVWGQWLLFLYLLSGSATGVSTPCSDFLSAVRSSPDLRLLRFSAGWDPCGSPYEVPADLPSLPWHPDSPTVVVVPGRRPPGVQPSWVRTMAGELLATGLSNVLAADWLAAPEQEITEGARQVGERLAQVIRALLDQGSSPGRFHLIGFGVGAHVAGMAGKCLHGAIGRITGLDPFAPVFSEANISFSLSYTDAQYVDVIHTNFNPNEPVAALGGSRPVGHVDFYISRGHQLPGCPPGLLKREEYLLCSHQWAYKIFTSSIHASCLFKAIPCRGVEDFYNAVCTDCHLPDLGVCPQLGYDISWLPVERPIPFRPLTAFLSITAKAPFCVPGFWTFTHNRCTSSWFQWSMQTTSKQRL
ncbi:lipase member I-like [Osmerus mordax]|uniref:lipase member I-like n=1 Tax=Osmerus mordax TaxID=8014 RepID=UPI00350EC1A1